VSVVATKPASRVIERDRRAEILDAAFDRFSRYGFRNTSIDDIARAAGISRPLVYQYFANKEDVLRELAAQLHEQVLDEALAVLGDGRPLADQLADALIAKLRLPVEVIGASEHAAELLDTSSRLAGDIAEGFIERYDGALQRRLAAARKAGELPARSAAIPITQLVRLLRDSATGIGLSTADSAEPWRQRIRSLTHLICDQEKPCPVPEP
jgi:TetR/AcrR family transcriptional regulator